jgi:Ca-activated chloride channel family protein
MRQLRVAGLAVLALLGLTQAARPQGLIVDRRPSVPVAGAFEVRNVGLDARIRDQVAEVQVTQTFHNPQSVEIEAEYLFPMPDEGAVQNFVLMVDGRELPGRLLNKDEARRIYEDIVRRKKDPALLEYMGQGLIRTSVFPIPPHAERTVTLRYTQLCRRDRDVVEFSYPLGTQKFTRKPIEKLTLKARIESKEPIKSVYCPGEDVEIKRDGDHEARVELTRRDVIPTSDFRLIYTLSEGAVGASVLSYRSSEGDDGYVLVLASPEVRRDADEERRAKTVVFVLDRSGSMTGEKIEQARNALKFVLRNLREGDTFNILAYDDRVESFKPELQRYDSEARDAAIKWVENLYPGGSTNIDEALGTALKMIKDRERPGYVLFLTDGLPTAGETNEAAIAKHAKEANDARARIFCFGVGYDVNARLLDRISGGNSGTSEYVKPDQDIEASVSRFFRRLTSPVLSDIRLRFEGTDINRGYPRDVPDLFEGGQIVWVGRYRESGKSRLRIEGRIGRETKELSFPADLASPGEGGRYRFVETLWAMRRVGYLIDQIDLNGQNRELTDELVELSKKYGILTPYTSFLADERVDLHAASDNFRRAGEQLSMLHEAEGRSGVAQRAYKARALNAGQAGGGFGGMGGMMGRMGDGAAPAQDYALAMRGAQAGQAPAAPAGPGQPVTSGGSIYAALRAPAANAAPVIAEDAEGQARVVGSVRRIGDKTFFRRGERWVDATVTPEQEAKARRIRQFSDDYFELARKQSAEMNQYLTFEEPVTVNLDGATYTIERPEGR